MKINSVKFLFIPVLICLVGFTSANAQTALDEQLKVEAKLLGLMLGYEKPLGGDFLLNLGVGQLGGFGPSVNRNRNTDFYFTTAFELEPRYYYNRNRRLSKGKNVRQNVGNYLALQFMGVPNWASWSTNGRDVVFEKSVSVIPTWGMRRKLAKNIVFDLELGVGYGWWEFDGSQVAVNLGIGFAYVFGVSN